MKTGISVLQASAPVRGRLGGTQGAVGLHGFTLLEVMVVIAIASILAAVGIPSFVGIMNDIRQKSAVNLLASDLNMARGEAIKRNARVLLCARNSAGTGCATTAATWTAGWVACADADANGACDAAATDVFVVRPALDSRLTLSALDSGGTAVTSVRFNANSTQGAGTLTVNYSLGGTWSGATTRSVSVANTGNISSH
jgi:prepilin-type N-terminal cleavage/methylation domain-containing protein